jgi:hypothetical protein
MSEALAGVPVMKVPAFSVVVGHAGIGCCVSHLAVEELGPQLWTRFVYHSQPTVQHCENFSVIIRMIGRKGYPHSKLSRAVDNAFPVGRPGIDQRRREKHCIFSVRVEMHKVITSCLVTNVRKELMTLVSVSVSVSVSWGAVAGMSLAALLMVLTPGSKGSFPY